MNTLNQKQLLFLKNNIFSAKQKTLCKKFEQYGGSFTFKIDDKPYKLVYQSSKAYTDYIFDQDYMKHRHGSMHRGAGPLLQDKYGKVNHQENNMIKKLDRKLSKK
jgi:hypothetical protein